MKVGAYWSHSFLPGLIRSDGVVFDFGVNSGGFSRLVAPLCAQVIGFEPDPAWEGKLDLPGNVRVIPKALAATRGSVRLHVNSEKCSSLYYADLDAYTVEVEALTLADALALQPNARIDLIKMDIEGEEVPVLQQADAGLFNRVVQMTVEFHDFLDPSSVPSIRSVIARMKTLGFVAFKMSWRSYGDVLFVNRALRSLSATDLISIGLIYRYGSGSKRVWRRVRSRWIQNK